MSTTAVKILRQRFGVDRPLRPGGGLATSFVAGGSVAKANGLAARGSRGVVDDPAAGSAPNLQCVDKAAKSF